MVHYYTAVHPNVNEYAIKLMSGEIDWILVGIYRWSDPDEKYNSDIPYGDYANKRLEVFYSGKTKEELEQVLPEHEKTDILLVCFDRTETTARFVQYLGQNGRFESRRLRGPLHLGRSKYVKSKNGGTVEGDFSFDIDLQTEDNDIPDFKEFVFPTSSDYPPMETKDEKEPEKSKKKQKGCIIC